MRIVAYTIREPKHARRGQNAIPAGTQLWLIKHRGRFFSFGYVRMKDAEKVRETLLADTHEHWEFNSKQDPHNVLHVVAL